MIYPERRMVLMDVETAEEIKPYLKSTLLFK